MAKKGIPKDASYVETYLNKGIDIPHRRISFGDIDHLEGGNDVDFGSIEMVLRGIDKMLDFSNKPITIHMSSYGGDAYQMMALYDKIQESPCKFIFYGRGMIMSSATWIMAGCDERYLSCNTKIMIHKGTTSNEGNLVDTEIATDEDNRFQNRLEEIYAENSFMPKSFWNTACSRDLYITPEEAITLGLVDKIVAYKKRGNFRKSGLRETAPPKREINKVITRCFKRIKLSVPKNLTIEVKVQEYETIKEYDNTKEELKKMGMIKDTNGKSDPTNGE